MFALLAHRAVFDCSLPLAAMFAGLPPSSSDLAERKSVVQPSPPAHSSPLGLVLAALAPLFERSAARTSRIRRRRRRRTGSRGAVLRRSDPTRFSSASDDKVGGYPRRDPQ
jgi:hypothetical protein